MVLVRNCTTNCIGSTFPTGFFSSLQWQFTSVWTAAHHRICRSTASRSPVLIGGGICVPPIVTYIYLPYRVSGSKLTAVGRSQLLAGWPGTHSRILYEIQRAAQTVLGVYLKRTCSRVTSASSALGVLNDYVLYRSTHSLTHSLTGLRRLLASAALLRMAAGLGTDYQRPSDHQNCHQLKTHLSVPALDSAGCSCGCRVPSSGADVTVQRVWRRLQMSRLNSHSLRVSLTKWMT